MVYQRVFCVIQCEVKEYKLKQCEGACVVLHHYVGRLDF